jgi:uncharacterized protein
MMVYLDANCVIYFVEHNPTWWPIISARLTALRAAKDELAVSDLTRTECLVGPFVSGNAGILASYRTFFTDPDIRVLPLTPAVCERAAQIRARYGFKVPDALHLAAAAEHACGLFLTNDAHLSRCTDITVEILR